MGQSCPLKRQQRPDPNGQCPVPRGRGEEAAVRRGQGWTIRCRRHHSGGEGAGEHDADHARPTAGDYLNQHAAPARPVRPPRHGRPAGQIFVAGRSPSRALPEPGTTPRSLDTPQPRSRTWSARRLDEKLPPGGRFGPLSRRSHEKKLSELDRSSRLAVSWSFAGWPGPHPRVKRAAATEFAWFRCDCSWVGWLR
jgi:hypothetical protein